MARRGYFEDLVTVAAALPWPIGVAFAAASFAALTWVIGAPALASGPAQPVIASLASVLRVIIPLGFLAGAGASAWRAYRRSALHRQVATAPSRATLEGMSWREFEALVGEAFRRQGYVLVERGGSRDGGVDVELRRGRDRYFVQCKQWRTQRVGVGVVRELYGVMAAERVAGGFVVTSGRFTAEAARFAQGRRIELVDASRLIAAVQGVPIVVDLAPRIPACPECGQPMVRRTARRGPEAGASFWGCPGFPSCKGTRPG
jgi:restriction system protein